jgi:hypothetical protein
MRTLTTILGAGLPIDRARRHGCAVDAVRTSRLFFLVALT